MKEKLLIVIAALILDMIFGDPHFLYHPVRAIGLLISMLEKRLYKESGANTLRGGILFILVTGITGAFYAFIFYAASLIGPHAAIVVKIYVTYRMIAARSLYAESMKVYRALTTGDEKLRLANARKAVAMIVGRDTDKLDEKGVCRACVETIAENASDGVIAPLFYAFIFGPMGIVIYKAVNTMDSMIGYRNERYMHFGTVAARADDVLNYIPSRICGLCFVAAAFLYPDKATDAAGAFKIFIRDRYNHKSPNSAQSESAVAGALGVRLAGDAYYFGQLVSKPYIGDEVRDIEPYDIVVTNNLMFVATGVFVGIGALLCCILPMAGIFTGTE